MSATDKYPSKEELLPDWAAWLAQDADGTWWAYEAEPNQHDVGWYENEVGRYVRVKGGERNPHWQNSLQRVGELDIRTHAHDFGQKQITEQREK